MKRKLIPVVLIALCIVILVVVAHQSETAVKAQASEPATEMNGWFTSVNVDWYTLISFESETNITPQSYKISGKHPEFWNKEHVHIRLYKEADNDNGCIDTDDKWCFDQDSFKRLGPDRP